MGTKKTVEEMVESLAIEMREGFAATDSKISKIDGKIDSKIGSLASEMRDSFAAMDKKIDSKIEGLALKMREGFEAADRKIETKIEGLAISVQQGFDHMDAKIDKLADRVGNVEIELKNVQFQAADLNPRVTALEKKVGIIGAKLGFQ